MPYSEQFCFRPDEIARPEVSGTHPARVESRDEKDIYAWLDESGRYRVKLDVDREFSESGCSYLWVRLAKPYAGANYGLHAPLVQGTEVGIAFDGGDPDRPYIAHAFHDSEHPDVVNRDNRSQNILCTPANNLMRMEDRRGEEHIATSTEYGKTQLNQGYIINAQEKPRGCGFELRTDEYGVIRVAKGLFVCADGQQKAVGEVLDRTTVLREIDIALQQMEQLNLAATQAEALCADIGSQRRMFSERLKPLNELIHFSAPEGMAFSSGERLQMAAAKNVAVNAGGDISAGATGSINLLAGQKAGLFARAGKLSVIAGQGALTVQAQNAKMKLVAAKKLSMSAESDILFAGKKRIVLTGGGSYLKLEDGKIEYGTEARYLRRTRKTYKAVPREMQTKLSSMQSVLPVLACGLHSCCFKVVDINANSQVIDFAWCVTTET
ncbi:type VI secretion system tip protein VgrG [Pantoea sp. S61]|uniref:type VI secretion system tip protein VgrG n=1 Tax=Pantoea sp. S61 TaxID=2767442 RepID=UPI00190DA22B|nr:type VI secretion system tip protein VgrG [Pantoea sp. S61]